MKTNLSEHASSVMLKDGRHLGFAEYGFGKGFPILFFHGLPGSRLDAEKLHLAACAYRIPEKIRKAVIVTGIAPY